MPLIFSGYSFAELSGEGAARVESCRLQPAQNCHLWIDARHVYLKLLYDRAFEDAKSLNDLNPVLDAILTLESLATQHLDFKATANTLPIRPIQ